MVAEFPGVVSFLSKLLAEDHISILNMSTYDTDVIYVQVVSMQVVDFAIGSTNHAAMECRSKTWRPRSPVSSPSCRAVCMD